MLVLHLLGVGGLFVALGAQAAALAAVRAADTNGAPGAACALARRARLAFGASAALVAVTGLCLLGAEERWRAPWAWASAPALAVACALALGAPAAWLRRLAGGPPAGVLPPAARLAQAGPAWALGGGGGMLVGVLWVMVLRPPLPGAAAALLAGAVLGLLVPAAAARRGTGGSGAQGHGERGPGAGSAG